VPLGLGLHALMSARRAVLVTEDGDGIENCPTNSLAQVGAVAGVTAANGGGNPGVYVPLFAEEFSAILVFIVVFAFMALLWCLAGKLLVSHPHLTGLHQRSPPPGASVAGLFVHAPPESQAPALASLAPLWS
jgi:cadmium resistance protein CadD (predicted permease)